MISSPKRPPNFLAAILLPLAVTVFVACSDSPAANDAELPTFTEHLDANGTVVRLTPPESWDRTYPVRIVQVNEEGQVVTDNVLDAPPTGDPVAQLTPAQRAAVERALESVADQYPDEAEIRKALQIVKEGK